MLDNVESPPSASTIATTVSTGCHMIKIDGYMGTKMLDNGKCIESCKFQAAGHTWCICYYPNGWRKEDAGCISMFLKLADKSTNVHTKLRFALDRHHGEPAPRTPTKGKHYTITFQSNGCWGLGDFMRSGKLEKSQYLKDDSFVVRCEIAVVNKPVVRGHGLEGLALVCSCKDDLCKCHHLGIMKGALGPKETFLRFFFGCLTL